MENEEKMVFRQASWRLEKIKGQLGIKKDLAEAPQSRVPHDARYNASATLDSTSKPRSTVKKNDHTWLVGIPAEAWNG